jgi:hypothetical protein
MCSFRNSTLNWTEFVAVALCGVLALSTANIAAQTYSTPEIIGSVAGLNHGANVNSRRAEANAELHRNDTVSTDRSGRARLNLRGRCLLTLGSGSQLKVLQSNPISQQSAVQLVTGRLRSQLGRFVVQNATYQVHTPHGTVAAHDDADFYIDANPDRTLLIVYSGIALITPAGRKSAVLDAAQGQMVELRAHGVTPLQLTSDDLEESSKQETSLAGEVSNGFVRSPQVSGSHRGRNIAIGLGIAAGALAGLVASRGGGGSSSSSTNQPTPPVSTPSIPAQ